MADNVVLGYIVQRIQAGDSETSSTVVWLKSATRTQHTLELSFDGADAASAKEFMAEGDPVELVLRRKAPKPPPAPSSMSKREDVEEAIRGVFGWVGFEDDIKKAADAVFAALRNPTLDMLKAATPAMKEIDDMVAFAAVRGGSPGVAWPDGDPPLAHAFRAMMDEAAK